MKKHIKQSVLLLAATLMLSVFSGVDAKAEAEAKQVDVIFMHDTHSHLDSFYTVENGETVELGGFARIKTVINEFTAENPDTLILDAGDFSMGTLIQTVFETDSAELRMLGALGCDVTTLGNHEFDYKSEGLANALTTAADSGDPVPQLLIANIDWETMEEAGLTEGQQMIKDAFETYGAAEYTVITKGDVDIAVFGIFGIDSLSCAPTCELLFEDPIESAKETVAEIKANEDVDMIVCISHSGTSDDEDDSEDENLAKAVPEIDVIVSGHTHTQLDEPIQHGDTYIVSCGEYGKRLGSFSMTQKEDGRWEMSDYKLTRITMDITPDEETQAKVDSLMERVDENYLSQFGYTMDQVVANNDVTFSTLTEVESIHEEMNLGIFIADAFIYAIESAPDFDGEPVAVAVVPSGCIRDTYAVGDITIKDVYNSYSLGIGEDGVPGYPLLSVYLTGAELKTIAEIDASISDLMTTARLFNGRFCFTFNPNRHILNKVTDCYLLDEEGNRVEIEDDKLYRVVADLYSGQMLGAVTDMSAGLLSIVPKYADGTPIEDLTDVIIYTEGEELKAWAAIAEYMESFPDTDGDGIGNVPEYYSEPQGRKVVDDSTNIIDLIKNPNKFTAIFAGVFAVVILLVILLILLVRKVIRTIRKKRTKESIN